MKTIIVDANILDNASIDNQNKALKEMHRNQNVIIRNIFNDLGLVFLYSNKEEPRPLTELLELRRVGRVW